MTFGAAWVLRAGRIDVRSFVGAKRSLRAPLKPLSAWAPTVRPVGLLLALVLPRSPREGLE